MVNTPKLQLIISASLRCPSNAINIILFVKYCCNHVVGIASVIIANIQYHIINVLASFDDISNWGFPRYFQSRFLRSTTWSTTEVYHTMQLLRPWYPHDTQSKNCVNPKCPLQLPKHFAADHTSPRSLMRCHLISKTFPGRPPLGFEPSL